LGSSWICSILRNEIIRIKKQIKPFLHIDEKTKETHLFSLANAFDNLENVGLSYIRNQYNEFPGFIFMIEIMNKIMDQIEDCYYNIDPDRHVYHDSYNNDYIRGIAEDNNYNHQRLSEIDSRNDADCNPDKPLELGVDWGSQASFLVVFQEQNFDFVTRLFTPTDNPIKEFFVKPERGHVMIDDLADKFNNYYSTQRCRDIVYERDRYGDTEKANTDKTYNEQFIDRLISKGWNVTPVVHAGMEPPHHDKYLLMGYTLKEHNPLYPKFRINANNCKYLLISMNNAEVTEKDSRFEKVKTSEKKGSGVAPEEATHLSDIVDRHWWRKYGQKLKLNQNFIDIRY
jgi:hypothetical protein